MHPSQVLRPRLELLTHSECGAVGGVSFKPVDGLRDVVNKQAHSPRERLQKNLLLQPRGTKWL